MFSSPKLTSASQVKAAPTTSTATPTAKIQELTIRAPKNQPKQHLMRFNASLNVDFSQWRNVKMRRENNMKEFRQRDEDMPKYGAGSEYNRDLREEARRKKFGINAKKYNPEAQPWILNVGGKNGKKFKGIREGGVNQNSAFYVFKQVEGGGIEAYPLEEWNNFQPIQRYKSLSSEEAEQEFARRKKSLNYFSLMINKRLKDEEEEEQDAQEVDNKNTSNKSKKLKISEMDEWIDSDDDSDSDECEEKQKQEEDSDDEGKTKKGNQRKEKKKEKRDLDDEAFEESDDGDEEGREMEYDTESSEDEPDPEAKLVRDMKSVAEEEALRNLLTSDEEDEEEKKAEEAKKANDEQKQKEHETAKNKKKLRKLAKNDKKGSSSGFSSDSSDSDSEDEKSKKKVKATPKASSSASSRSDITKTSTTVETNKRKLNSMLSDAPMKGPASMPDKRPKIESAPSLPSTFTEVVTTNNKTDSSGITEDAVRRYLMRKPMTAVELLSKFRNKTVSAEQLVDTITAILKKINPFKQIIQGKMHMSIKANN